MWFHIMGCLRVYGSLVVMKLGLWFCFVSGYFGSGVWGSTFAVAASTSRDMGQPRWEGMFRQRRTKKQEGETRFRTWSCRGTIVIRITMFLNATTCDLYASPQLCL